MKDGRLGPFVTAELQRATMLNDGSKTHYARGLYLESHRGLREVSHSGATAGYRAWLGRFPDLDLSLAVLCNAGNDDVNTLAYAVADPYLPGETATPPQAAVAQPNLATWAGWYTDNRWGQPLYLVASGNKVQSGYSSNRLEATGGGSFRLGPEVVTLLSGGQIQIVDIGNANTLTTFTRVPAYVQTTTQLTEIAGRYRSVETDADYIVTPEAGGLRLTIEQRPGDSFLYKPAYADAFRRIEGAGMLRLVRGPRGGVIALRLSDDRVWDLRADRVQ